MNIPIYQADAFASEVFAGNPAAIMPLEQWLPDKLLQSIAMENNLSETAYLVAKDAGYELRWFTPDVEVDLCGHATLASAHVLFEHLAYEGEEIVFYTRSGELRVTRSSQGLTLDLPAIALVETRVEEAVCAALGAQAVAAAIPAHQPWKVVYEFADEQQVKGLRPDFRALLEASEQSVVVTAPGEQVDFVSRFFGPQVGIDEDPVTGSAHCCLMVYWAEKLGRTKLSARQVSARGGDLQCELIGDRVYLTGQGVTFMTGTVVLPEA